MPEAQLLIESLYKQRTTCRLCKSKNLKTAFPMVPIPQGDGYVPYERRHEVEALFPHDIMFCADCGNIQTSIDVDQRFIYDHYIWTTSISPGLVELYKKYVDSVISRFCPTKNGFAVEIGSNDGTFSKLLKEQGLNVLAIDPAQNLAEQSKQKGVETLVDYFRPELAEQIEKQHGKADLIIGNHVFANVNDVDVIIAGAKQLLKPDGVFIIQVFYLYDVVKNNFLENFNHEHPSYFYARSLRKFFNSYGLELFDVERIPAKGGSLRCFVQHAGGPQPISKNVDELIAKEEEAALHKVETYQSLSHHIEDTRNKFKNFFDECRAQSKTVAAYGTSIGATIFTYQYGLGEDLQFFVDDDPARHNLVTPGFHIPVMSPDAIYEKKPDYVIVMAPLYADIIIGKHQKYLEQGGHFVKFRPEFQIV